MSAKINLETAPINLGEWTQKLPTTCAFKKDKFIRVLDFGTVFIGNLSDDEQEISNPQPGTFIFSAPENWRMPQLLRALGVFKSASEAAKNGWNMDVPIGCSSFLVRANKIVGEIWIHKGR